MYFERLHLPQVYYLCFRIFFRIEAEIGVRYGGVAYIGYTDGGPFARLLESYLFKVVILVDHDIHLADALTLSCEMYGIFACLAVEGLGVPFLLVKVKEMVRVHLLLNRH